MRLLHTSDWHLGRSFHRVSLLDAQAAYLDHLVATVREREVDVVLVAGDVYDRAVPPLTAVELFDQALHRLAAAGVPTVMISGNHDSARRLGVGAGLFERAGIHLRTDPEGCATPVVLADDHGDVAFYGLPYLEPALVKDALGAAKAGHEAVLTAAMDRVRADLATRPAGTRSVVLALAYSFSEADHRKTMWLVDLDADGGIAAEERIDCPAERPLARLRGRLDTLLEDPALDCHEHAWVEATLTDPVRPAEPMARLARRFPHTLSLVFDPERPPEDPLASYAQRLKGRDDHQIAEDFVAHVRGGSGPSDLERTVLRGAFDDVRVDETVREVSR